MDMNKPVAWMDENENVIFEKNWAYPIPLYTHPVKEEAEQQSYQEADGCPTELAVLKRFWRQHNPVKELTISIVDIDNLIDQFWYSDDAGFHFHYYDFAEAILRKAQEK